MKSVLSSIFQNQYFWLLTLSILSHEVQSVSKESKEPGCAGIMCKSPPSETLCEIVSKSDRSLPRPSGPNAECCPLWRCKDDKGSKKFHTFHGLDGSSDGQGGSEKVSYDNSEGSSIVSSIASGDHDAIAFAGDGSEDEIQATLDAILAQLQLKR